MSRPELITVNNPLRMVAAATWDLLLASSLIKDRFKAGNRIIHYHGSDRTVTEKEQPIEGEVGAGDLPEIWLFQSGIRPHLGRTTSGSSLELEWLIAVSSGRQNLGRLLDAEWLVWQALHLWDEHVKPLQWEGAEFVTAARPLKVESSLENDKLNRGITQWSDVWRGQTDMWFSTTDLRGGL